MNNPIICAIDTMDLGQAVGYARRLAPVVGGIKLGLEFFVAHGAPGVRRAAEDSGHPPLFLDLKLHDIPNTVAGAVRAAAPLKPRFLTVHAAGGPAMLRAAAQTAAELGAQRPMILAVTILTSLAEADLARIGMAAKPVDELVLAMATLARECGIDGVVCSPREVAKLRAELGKKFLLVVPGVRPQWAGTDDQKRIMTPAEAMRAGADHLVIGRPILTAKDPVAAAKRIAEEVAAAGARG